MSATAAISVEIDPTISADPQLLQDVQAATDFFEELVAKYPEIQAEDRMLSWKLVTVPGDQRVDVTYQERDRYGQRSLSAYVRPAQLMDPISRKIELRSLLRGVVHQRSRQISRVMDELLRELDEENNGQSS